MKLYARDTFISICVAVAAILIVVTLTMVVSQPANAKPEFAAQTGLPCGKCHQNPAGGGPRKPFGEKFKANGFKLSK
jgi:hypothetical protein